MKNFPLSYVFFGMAMQAFSNAFCIYSGLVKISGPHQVIVGLMFMLLSIYIVVINNQRGSSLD